MRVTTIDGLRTAPGRYLEFPVVPTGTAVPSDVPPCFNQQSHLRAADGDDSSPGTWLCGVFDVDGPIDEEALQEAFQRLVDTHATLRSQFAVADDGARTPQRSVHPAGSIRVGAPVAEHAEDEAQPSVRLRGRLDEQCRPLRFPNYVLAAISRPGTSTIVCGFDHVHVDALSLAIAIDEVAAAYAGVAPAVSVPGDGHLDYCREEAAAEQVDPHDPRLAEWIEFLADAGGHAPEFPLELGVPIGESAPQHSAEVLLLDADEAEAFSAATARAGGTTYAGLLTALAMATHAAGGSDLLPLTFPAHTRYDERYARALGWFVTSAPITVSVHDDGRPADPCTLFERSVALTQQELRRARDRADVPLGQVIAATTGGYRPRRQDVFMASYLDYRRITQGDSGFGTNRTHVSNITRCDDVQLWFSRTHDGVSVRTRHPDTPQAHRTMRTVLQSLRSTVAVVAVPQKWAA
ncbi:hypothetical protein AXK56_12785 [Tsukamurella pulmonis]|uniref:Condensation domain-containing protein n=1 Tax=Tsukamurella pulmonis TaxID=47312 RepID=A0A1H1GUX6_9ACTN|nr:condensation domain-containing protein [Tsukamurella pulmonis]KXO88233.1 hypothetical protein AXK56_12785 [Tsukamurella pulmonis]SDR16987.1 Condensation domain-containing protein [Tsukamurella pulmonis]SUP16543.1 Trehalose-2-sulfate acyltransferase papA2 [Tsukamurella pulmonis]